MTMLLLLWFASRNTPVGSIPYMQMPTLPLRYCCKFFVIKIYFPFVKQYSCRNHRFTQRAVQLSGLRPCWSLTGDTWFFKTPGTDVSLTQKLQSIFVQTLERNGSISAHPVLKHSQIGAFYYDIMLFSSNFMPDFPRTTRRSSTIALFYVFYHLNHNHSIYPVLPFINPLKTHFVFDTDLSI